MAEARLKKIVEGSNEGLMRDFLEQLERGRERWLRPEKMFCESCFSLLWFCAWDIVSRWAFACGGVFLCRSFSALLLLRLCGQEALIVEELFELWETPHAYV